MKGLKTMDVILIILGVITIAFTIEMIHIFKTQYAVPDSLVTSFFTAVASECGFMGLIKSMKIRHEDRKWMKEDIKELKEEEKNNGRN